MKLIISLIFIFFINLNNSSILNLKDSSNCVYPDSKGNSFDLSSIGYMTFQVKTEDLLKEYAVNLCQPLEESQICGKTEGVSICTADSLTDPTWSFILGFLPATQLTNNLTTDHNIDLLYDGQSCKNGLNQYIVETTVNAKCHSENKILEVTPSTVTSKCAKTYRFDIGSPIFCQTQKGLSGGDVFLIIFFVGFGVYFIVGSLIQLLRKRNGQQVESIIPNIEFWRSFGSLIKDGALYIKSKVTGTSTNNYTPI